MKRIKLWKVTSSSFINGSNDGINTQAKTGELSISNSGHALHEVNGLSARKTD